MLRPGNVHSAHNWREVLDPIVARYGRTGVRRSFRADAAFAKPEVYEYLEERRVLYAIRLPSSCRLYRCISGEHRRYLVALKISPTCSNSKQNVLGWPLSHIRQNKIDGMVAPRIGLQKSRNFGLGACLPQEPVFFGKFLAYPH